MMKGKIFELLAATALLSGTGAPTSAIDSRETPVRGIRLPGKEWNKRKKRRKMQSDSRKNNR